MNASVTLSSCKQDQTKNIVSFSLTVFVETKNTDFLFTLVEEQKINSQKERALQIQVG